MTVSHADRVKMAEKDMVNGVAYIIQELRRENDALRDRIKRLLRRGEK